MSMCNDMANDEIQVISRASVNFYSCQMSMLFVGVNASVVYNYLYKKASA